MAHSARPVGRASGHWQRVRLPCLRSGKLGIWRDHSGRRRSKAALSGPTASPTISQPLFRYCHRQADPQMRRAPLRGRRLHRSLSAPRYLTTRECLIAPLVLLRKIKHQEPPHINPLIHEQAWNALRPWLGPARIVLRYHPQQAILPFTFNRKSAAPNMGPPLSKYTSTPLGVASFKSA